MARYEAAIGPSPVDRARPGSKHHVLTDATGIPLAVLLTGGTRHDVTQLKPLLDAVPPIRGRVGRPRRKPRVLVADRGYDFDKYRRQLRSRDPPDDRPAGRGARLGAGSLAVDGWSAPWPGCTSIGGCGSGGNVALTSMRASSSWPCVQSAGAACTAHSVRSF
jgi:hypothetical protein